LKCASILQNRKWLLEFSGYKKLTGGQNSIEYVQMSIIHTGNCYMITRDEVTATNQLMGVPLLNQPSMSASQVFDGSKIQSVSPEHEGHPLDDDKTHAAVNKH